MQITEIGTKKVDRGSRKVEAEQYSTSECFDGWRKPIQWTPSDLAERMGAIGPCKGIIVRFSHHGGR